MLKGKFDHFGLGYKPYMKQMRKEVEKQKAELQKQMEAKPETAPMMEILIATMAAAPKKLEEQLERVNDPLCTWRELDKIDTDGDGYISRDEFKVFIKEQVGA